MQTESIFSTLLAAAVTLRRPFEDLTSHSLKGAYDAVMAHLRRKFGDLSEAKQALDLATAKPESLMRKALLAEESAADDLEGDAELARLVANLATLLPSRAMASQQVHVNGRGHRVQVVGRDLIQAESVVRRNAITPDERHLSVEQRDRLRAVIREVGDRLEPGVGKAGGPAVHAMLQRRFRVPSYLLIPREQFDEALSFLRQQRAIHRAGLRSRDPIAYVNDLYRAIFAGARELGWSGEQVYRCATERLALKRPLGSLKELGLVQLKTLARVMQREVRTKRERGGAGVAADPISA